MINAESLPSFETQLREAMQKAQDQGCNVINGLFGVYNDEGTWKLENASCDPLGALLVDQPVSKDDYDPLSASLFDLFGLTPGETEAFTDGFDGKDPAEDGIDYLRIFSLGKDMRSEYDPIDVVIE